MADSKQKSRKQLKSSKRLKGFTLYLCHNLDYDDCVDKLRHCGFRYKRHRDYFKGWTEDRELLPLVGKRKWILITFDQKQRTRAIEQQLIVQYKVRQFVFTSGGIGNIGDLLCKAKGQMRSKCANNSGPFVFSISATGKVAPRHLQG
ncbi:MAG TPA: hypothetical protein VLA96_14600 [Terriglobales bacterium]|nr:hypothetical protein [Terriglobales bacterium]